MNSDGLPRPTVNIWRARWNVRIRGVRMPGTLLSAFIVIMDFEQQAALLGFERTMMNAGRAAGIGRAEEGLAALALRVAADDEIAGEEINLLPMIVHKGRRGVDARIEAQQPRAAAHLLPLVDVACEDLLLDARRIVRRRRPSRAHVECDEFQMGFVHRHGRSLFCLSKHRKAYDIIAVLDLTRLHGVL